MISLHEADYREDRRATSPTPRAGAQAGVEVVRRFHDAWNDANLEGCLALVAEDVAHEPASGGMRRGKAACREYRQQMLCCYWEHVGNLVQTPLDHTNGIRADYRLERVYLGPGCDEILSCERLVFDCQSMFELDGGMIVSIRDVGRFRVEAGSRRSLKEFP
jgi:hypothetical protein